MSNFILKNISGSDLSLPILEGTTAETLSNNQTINLLEFVSVSDTEKSLKFGDLKTNLANGNISLIKNSIGFVNRYNCVLQTILDDIDDGYISFSISPVEASFSFNQQLNTLGDLSITTYTKNTQELLAIPYVKDVPAIYRVYYEDDTLSYENINDKTSYNFSDINKTEICNIWYDGYFAYTFDLRQESYEPWVEGILQDQNQLKYKSGLQTTISAELDPGQISISPGYLIQNTSKLYAENDVMFPLYAPILYRETSTTNSNHNNWKTTFNATSLITLDNNGNVAYNKYESNSWFVFPSTNSYYVPYWIVATNCIEYPIMIIVGQNQYDSLENAAYYSRFDKLKIDNNLIKNFKPLYSAIIKTDTNTIAYLKNIRNKNVAGDAIETFTPEITQINKFIISKGNFSSTTTFPTSVGAVYVDQNEIEIPTIRSVKYRVILSASENAVGYVDLYDTNGVISGGTPSIISSSEINTRDSFAPPNGSTPNSLSPSAYEIDVSSAFLDGYSWTEPGVFESRLWLEEIADGYVTVCNSAELIFSVSTFPTATIIQPNDNFNIYLIAPNFEETLDLELSTENITPTSVVFQINIDDGYWSNLDTATYDGTYWNVTTTITESHVGTVQIRALISDGNINFYSNIINGIIEKLLA